MARTTDTTPTQDSECPAQRARATVSVVVPCFNEEPGIEQFYRVLKPVLEKLEGCDHEMVFVDDGSRDATLAVLERLAQVDSRLQVYALSRNYGHQIALTAGSDVASGDAIVFMDCDLQHPPSLIPAMLDLWKRGADIVSAVRVDTAGASIFKKWSSRLFYWLINALSDTEIARGAADFCLLSRNAHDALRSMPERHRFLRGMIAWLGFRREFLPFEAPERSFGTSKYTFHKMLSLATTAITSHSVVPLRLASKLGLLISLMGLFYLAYILYASVAWPQSLERGWSSLMSVILLLGGIQLIFVGLLGEYLGRVYEETKARPLYFFKRRPAPTATTAPLEVKVDPQSR